MAVPSCIYLTLPRPFIYIVRFSTNAFQEYYTSGEPERSYSHKMPSRNQVILHRPRRDLYDAALRHVYSDRGTRYDISQNDIDRITHPRGHPTAPYRSLQNLETEIVAHNRLERVPGQSERAAIRRLKDAISWCERNRWGPDLVVKAFLDLDKIFFCSRLRDLVKVMWKPSVNSPGHYFCGLTKRDSTHPDSGRYEIWLNADEIIRSGQHIVFPQMFVTILHEMW